MADSAKRRIVEAFLAGISAGQLPETLLHADFSAWTGSSGDIAGAQYSGAVKKLATIFKSPLQFEIIGLTAEGDRIAAEVTSKGELIDGQPYANAYHFLLRLDGDRIIEVREYMNTKLVSDVIRPLMMKS